MFRNISIDCLQCRLILLSQILVLRHIGFFCFSHSEQFVVLHFRAVKFIVQVAEMCGTKFSFVHTYYLQDLRWYIHAPICCSP